MLDLCTETKLRILNDNVQTSLVQDLIFLSDHGPILLTLTRNYIFNKIKTIKETQVCQLKHKPTRYTRKNSLGKDFESRLCLETDKISNILLGNESDTNFRSDIKHTLLNT